MGLRNEIRRRFQADPGAAIAFVRDNSEGRARRTAVLLDGLLEEADRLIAKDPQRAVQVAETALGLTAAATSTAWLRARSYGVLGSAYGMVRRSKAAMRLIASGLSIGAETFEKGSLLMRKSVVLCHLFRWQEALMVANEGVQHFEVTRVPRETEFCSLAMALAVRPRVLVDVYQAAPDLPVSMLDVVKDCDSCLELIGRQKRFTATAAYALHNKGLAVSVIGLTGLPVARDHLSSALDQTKAVQRQLLSLGLSRRSLHWGLTLWVEGHLEAQLAGELTGGAERLFRSGRDLLIAAEATEQAVSLTLEYQWWLLRSGRGLQAVYESEFLEDQAGRMGPHAGAVRQWVAALRARRIGEELRRVFREVRGLEGVALPKPVRRRVSATWPSTF